MTAESIKDSIAKARDYLRQHPDQARYTDTEATATIEEGLRCQVVGPSGATLTSDMSPGVGGRGSAPSPGWLLRAAHAACDATLIAMRAAEVGVELSRLEVTVDSESDDRGLLGMDQAIPAGPLRTRVWITVEANGVAESTLRDVVEWARKHSPVDEAMLRAVPVSAEVETGSPG